MGHRVPKQATPPRRPDLHQPAPPSWAGADEWGEASLEEAVVHHTTAILRDAADHRLKAVELANTLRARLGNDALAAVRTRCGGLLNLLDRHPLFRVIRIPKSDTVKTRGSCSVSWAIIT